MDKKKTSQKRSFSLSDIPIVKTKKSIEGLSVVDTESCFKDIDQVARTLFQCMIEGDSEAFMEILDGFLLVNRKAVARKQDIARSTVQQAFSKKGNPTLKTIIKIVHGTVSDQMVNKTEKIRR